MKNFTLLLIKHKQSNKQIYKKYINSFFSIVLVTLNIIFIIEMTNLLLVAGKSTQGLKEMCILEMEPFTPVRKHIYK